MRSELVTTLLRHGKKGDPLSDALAAAIDQIKHQEEAVLRLTPGGSEFVGDFDRCIEFIGRRMSVVMKLAAAKKEIEAQLDELRKVAGKG